MQAYREKIEAGRFDRDYETKLPDAELRLTYAVEAIRAAAKRRCDEYSG